MSQAMTSAREIRRARGRRLAIRFAMFVAFPTLVASGYYGCLASPQYESVSVLKVESDNSGEDAGIVRTHILSRDMLALLVEDHGFLDHFQDDDKDWWSRLDGDAGSEEAYDYFLDHVKVKKRKGQFTLRVRAYSAEAAQTFSHAIITAAQIRLDGMSRQLREDRMKVAQDRLADTQERLIEVRARIEALRPAAAKPEALPDHNQVARYQQAMLEKELLQASYEEAFKALERLRSEASQTRRYLATISAPSMPTAPTHPRRFWGILTVFALASTLLIVVSLIIAGVREHGQF